MGLGKCISVQKMALLGIYVKCQGVFLFLPYSRVQWKMAGNDLRDTPFLHWTMMGGRVDFRSWPFGKCRARVGRQDSFSLDMSILMGTWGYVLGVCWDFLRNMVADWQTELAGANGREHFLVQLEYLESLLIGRTIGSDLKLNTPGFDQHIGTSKKMCQMCQLFEGEILQNTPMRLFFGMYSGFGEMKSFTW